MRRGVMRFSNGRSSAVRKADKCRVLFEHQRFSGDRTHHSSIGRMKYVISMLIYFGAFSALFGWQDPSSRSPCGGQVLLRMNMRNVGLRSIGLLSISTQPTLFTKNSTGRWFDGLSARMYNALIRNTQIELIHGLTGEP